MNYVSLKGILRNIQPSHSIKGIEYDKADLIVKRGDGEDDVLSLRFKRFSNKHKDGDEVEICGQLRSFSRKDETGKNKVEIYVFTYFDLPEPNPDGIVETNDVEIDGRICKMGELRTTKSGKQTIHFTLANNIISNDGKSKINNYIPCVAWGKLAQEAANFKVNDKIELLGQFHSRTYKKKLENDELEIRTAHEAVILDYNMLEE